MKISITRTDRGLQIRLHGDTNQFELALETMKQEIPRQGRRFDAQQRCWIVEQACLSHLESWLSRMRRQVNADVVYKNHHSRPGSSIASKASNAYETLHLLPTAPPELVKAAYRCLAMINHPDRGGDTESMQQINSAYAQLSAAGA